MKNISQFYYNVFMPYAYMVFSLFCELLFMHLVMNVTVVNFASLEYDRYG